MDKLFQSRCKFLFVIILTHLLAQWATPRQLAARVDATRELQGGRKIRQAFKGQNDRNAHSDYKPSRDFSEKLSSLKEGKFEDTGFVTNLSLQAKYQWSKFIQTF
nr:AlNc14C119G6622 [Albugo laibachii Nc14]|eukprot:CCA21338.1 AlNc14C119G6622 [Albugo laibachii Nc14]